MAKFCVNCGTSIEDGAVCNCTQENPSAATDTSATTAVKTETAVNINVDVNKAVNQGLTSVITAKNIIFKMLTKPVSTFSEVIKTPNLPVGVTFIIAYGLIWGLITMSFIKTILSATSGILGGMLREFGLLGFFYNISDLIPSSKAFFFGFFAIVIQAVAIIGVLIIANSLMKGRGKYQSITTMVGLSFAPSIIFTIAAWLLSYMSFNLSMGALVIGGVLNIILLYIGTKDVLALDGDRAIYLIPVINIITAVVAGMYVKNSITSMLKGLMNTNPFGW